MLHPVPKLSGDDERVLGELAELRERLKYLIAQPRKWTGLLRRTLTAAAIAGSNSIEGIVVNQSDAEAAVVGEDPTDTDADAWHDVLGYRDALTYVRQLAEAPEFSWHPMLFNGLHHIMLKHTPDTWPGRFRLGEIRVTDRATGDVVYTGPDADSVPALMAELSDWLNTGDLAAPPYVRAAMAHLNLASVHPWRDGNGRMSRCVHTLVMARCGELAPEFSSIEEWLGRGRNTYDYYDALAHVQRGRFAPGGGGSGARSGGKGAGDTLAWVRFNLRAHHLQAQLVQRRAEQASRLWTSLADLAEVEKLPGRTVTALYEAVRNGAVRRTLYQHDEELSTDQAARDLRMLTARGLLEARGETKARRYFVTPALIDRTSRAFEAWGELAPLREPYGDRRGGGWVAAGA
ncbi:MAG: Fic family protein [Actinocrinis sp.]